MKSKGRRGSHEGNIRERKDGRWEARVTLQNGKPKSIYGKTREAARAKMIEVLHAIDIGAPIAREERLTVKRYLDDWLERKRPDLRPLTLIRYRIFMAPVSDALGSRRLNSLTAAQLERFYADLRGAGLSATTIHHTHVALRQALADAERLGFVPRNVATLARAPKMGQTELHVFTPEQAQAFLKAAAGERLEAMFVLAITTGMREGELLALRWRDVNLDASALDVLGTLHWIPQEGFQIGPPKTPRSRRRVELTPQAMVALRGHRARQGEERLASGLGQAWGDARWPDLVFTNEVGRPIDANNLLKRQFYPLLRRAELPKIRFHDLRHTCATLLLPQGVNPKIVSEMLGHSSVGLTLDRYSHVLPGMQRTAVDALEKALFGG
jgi:integrase